MDVTPLMFYLMSAIVLCFSFAVIVVPNPIYSALSLAGAMVSLAFVFFLLEAYFIAAVQLIVYAGAVMVLFVMVLMLFDLKKEVQAFSKGAVRVILVLVCCGMILGYLKTSIVMSTEMILSYLSNTNVQASQMSVRALSTELFSNYLFAFEALGVLLLLVAVGVVSVARSKGGSHADS